MIRNRLLCLVTIASSALLGACGGGSQSAPPPSTHPPATAAAGTSAAGSVAAGDFGVPECDEYMTKYLACIESKVPASARAMLKQSMEQQKTAWKQAAATPEGRNGLAMGCKAAADQTKAVVASYGCTW